MINAIILFEVLNTFKKPPDGLQNPFASKLEFPSKIALKFIRMISLVFPRNDIEASDIALKVSLDSENIYMVPKYSFREEEVVFSRLNKSRAAILLITDPFVSIDNDTRKEITYLLKNGKPVYAIFPKNSRAEVELEELKTNFEKLLHLISYDAEEPQSILERVKTEIENERAKKETDLTPLFLIIAGLLLLYLLSDS